MRKRTACTFVVWRPIASKQTNKKNHLPSGQATREIIIQSVWFNHFTDFWAFIISHHTCSDCLQGGSSWESSKLPPVPHVARTADSELAAHESVSHSNRLVLEPRFDQSGARRLHRNPCCCSFQMCRRRGGGVTWCVVHKASFSAEMVVGERT